MSLFYPETLHLERWLRSTQSLDRRSWRGLRSKAFLDRAQSEPPDDQLARCRHHGDLLLFLRLLRLDGAPMNAFILNDFSEAARAFVLDSYVRSMIDASKEPRDLVSHLVKAGLAGVGSGLRAHLTACLDVGKCQVATPIDRPDVFLGWALARGPHLDYVYVKKDIRGYGLARELVMAVGPIARVGFVTRDWMVEKVGDWL